MPSISTGIPCGSCPTGVLTIRRDGYVFCPECEPQKQTTPKPEVAS